MEPRPYGPFPYTPINRRPKLRWPNGARVAVWVIPNIESFALDEKILGDRPMPEVQAFSQRDYGARIGVFRIVDGIHPFFAVFGIVLQHDMNRPQHRHNAIGALV